MSLFEFLVTLYSIVTGLGLTLLVRSLGQMLETRRRTRLYWVHTCWLGILLVAYVVVWFQLWSYRDVASWTVVEGLLLLSVPVSLYLVSHLAVPELEDGAQHDMRTYYYEHHRLLQGLLALSVALSTLAAGLILDRWSAEPWLMVRLIALALLAPGIVSRRPQVHALQVVLVLGLMCFAVTELRRPISE
jgi:MFS family permease